MRFIEFFQDETGHLSSMRLFLFVMVFVIAFILIYMTVKSLGWITATQVISIITIIFGSKLIQKKLEDK